MNRSLLYDLVKAYYNGDEVGFGELVEKIANSLRRSGESSLGSLLMELKTRNTKITIPEKTQQNNQNPPIVPNYIFEKLSLFLESQKTNNEKIMLNKLFFYGIPGTGKTAVSEFIASNLLEMPIIKFSFTNFVDSKLGESLKNFEKTLSSSRP